MPYYYKLRSDYPGLPARGFVIDRLLALKAGLNAGLPGKDLESHLLLATWNIRDLGKTNRRGFGPRLRESLYYIAEIISRFDLVAVQEVNELEELRFIMSVLGPEWDYIATDVADTSAGGNGERMTFVYDKRKVVFRNIAGEIVLPPDLLISRAELQVEGQTVVAGKQFRRTPFIVSFQAGWFKFDLCTVHIYYGKDSGQQLRERVEEIDLIAGYLGKRANEAFLEDKSLILLGDFNIVHPEHQTMEALLRHKFRIPESLKHPTNIDRSKFYDQIAFKTKTNQLEYIDLQSEDPRKRNAGILDVFASVFRPDEYEHYRPALLETGNGQREGARSEAALQKYYNSWRTYQMSDHHLMWVRLDVNSSEEYLKKLKEKV